ncbi:MAG TPA: hypothetical protein VLG16_05495 [Candidatus Saccharimonadales bacterium]|nr:hypothetical protein [Candidatus Saccharimonadales bacterium]
MNTTEHALLIILSAALALFLILAITVVIMVMVLLRRLQTVASKAEEIVDTTSDIVATMRKTVGSFTFFSALRGVAETLSHFKHHKER